MLGCCRIYYSKEVVISESAPRPIGPYSQAVAFENLLFVSGQIGIDSNTNNLVSGGIEQEFRQIMENIKKILEAGNSDLQKVLKVTIYLTDIRNFSKINTLYSEYFNENFPARETVEVVRLPKEAQIEVSVIAFRKK
jgi:2-iminobutanoate/2-iminopropanoate deaminase